MNGNDFSILGRQFITLALLLVTAVNALLGFIVLRAARREENRIFALLAGSVALWTLTNALFRIASSAAIATLWAQVSYGAALATAAALLHFSWIYPLPPQREIAIRLRLFKWGVWAAAAMITVSVWIPGWAIEAVDIEARRIITGRGGITLIALFLSATLSLAIATFYDHQKRLRRKARAQARYVLFGFLLTTVVGLTFNLAFPLVGDYRFVWAGPLSSLFFVGFSGYSIIAHHLFDVRLLIRRTLVYSLLLAFSAGAFAAMGKGLELLLRPFLGGDAFSTDLLAALVVGFTVDPLKRALHQVAAKALFRDEPADDPEE